MRQVSEWADYYAAEPWGYEAIDTRNALLAHVVATSQGAKGKDGKPFSLDTFRLRPRVEQAPRPGYELADKIRAIFKVPRPKEG